MSINVMIKIFKDYEFPRVGEAFLHRRKLCQVKSPLEFAFAGVSNVKRD